MPNPFEVLGNGIVVTVNGSLITLTPLVLNWIAGTALYVITFAVVGLYYDSGSAPAFGSFLYMLFFVIHTFLLYPLLMAYPVKILMAMIIVMYIGFLFLIWYIKDKLLI